MTPEQEYEIKINTEMNILELGKTIQKNHYEKEKRKTEKENILKNLNDNIGFFPIMDNHLDDIKKYIDITEEEINTLSEKVKTLENDISDLESEADNFIKDLDDAENTIKMKNARIIKIREICIDKKNTIEHYKTFTIAQFAIIFILNIYIYFN